MSGVEITIDLSCVNCEYNLRGLDTTGKCPECGSAISESLAAMAPRGTDGEFDFLDRVRKAPYVTAARIANVTPDAVMCVRDAIRDAFRIAKASGGTAARVNGRDVCDAFRKLVNWYFNDREEGVELLAEWGIRTSEDVGRIVFAMAEANLLRTQEGDCPEDFLNLFTLDTLFDEPLKRSTVVPGNFIRRRESNGRP